ncbi:E3 ubiquitin-protein ligase TRIM71-like [Saccostrea cucullata]|uniref:E3 ubiquitin-protein ligase TRIM71-like n=1 Tax=Saccostrea cuccullata TaxID=36930 RepID=UPI002ED68147
MDSISKTISDDFLTCTICYEIYTEPTTLPCLHSFCKLCIANFIQKDDTKRSSHCPICRDPFSDDQNSLKTNFFLQNMIDLIESSSKLFCSFCKITEKEHIAVSQCISCLDYLCEDCTKTHALTRQTVDHKVVPISEIREGKYVQEIQSVQKIRCSQHPDETLRYFCIQCNLLVCRDCIIFEHKSHDFKPISDARKEKENNISEVMGPLKEKLEAIKQNNAVVGLRMEELVDRETIIQNQIKQTCTKAINSIRKNQKKMEDELRDRIKPGKDNLLHIWDRSSKMCTSIEESLNFSEKVLKRGNDIEVLPLLDEIFNRLTKLERESKREESNCPAVDVPDFQITWDEPRFTFLGGSGYASCNWETGSNEREKLTTAEKTNMSGTLSESVPNLSSLSSDVSYKIKLLENLDLKEDEDEFKPVYSSVAWINEENIAVVDKQNEKIKLLNLSERTIKSVNMARALAVSVYKHGVACRAVDLHVKVFHKTLKEFKKKQGVFTLATSSPQNPALIWMTKHSIFTDKDGNVSKVSFRDEEGNPTALGNPRYACCLPNELYVVSDGGNNCVYFIESNGEIIRTIDHHPGSIAYDKNHNVFITNFFNRSISIFDPSGSYLSEISIGKWKKSPRCISILENRMLIANECQILLFELKSR